MAAATPSRSGAPLDFDMSSARKPDTAVDQRYAKLVAEAELKLIEEKARAHEREAKLKELLAQERAKIPTLVNERVEQILSERGGATDTSNSAEVAQLRQQLAETQRLLADAERRYQQEKRELLTIRTAQLKGETAKRGQEGDIIAKAMQVMSEYETIVRSSEENSLARLAHHMENFEAEWVRRSKEFEDRKAEFEGLIMSKALEALKEHTRDVESIGEAVLQRTMRIIKEQSKNRLDVERHVLQQSEEFKVQYKALLDDEFRERCRAYDERVAERERNLVQIVQQERDRIIEAEAEAVKRAEATHVHALVEAMKELSELREQIVREHHAQQQKALEDLISRRDELQAEQNKALDSANAHVRTIEERCFAAVEAAQESLREMQMELAAKEAGFTERLAQHDAAKEKAHVADIAAVREEVEGRWKRSVEAMRAEHLQELEALRQDCQLRLEKEHAELFSREQELYKLLEVRLKHAEEAAESRWTKRLAEASRGLERHLEAITALRDDNDQLNHQITLLHQQISQRESEYNSKMAAVQREQEHAWHVKLDEMRQRYDQLLDEALGGPLGDTVTRLEHEKVLESLRELEERCVNIKKGEAQRLTAERQQLNDMWRARLEQERAERATWEEEQLQRLSEMRIEMDADLRRKESELVRRLEQERARYHEEATLKTAEDRRDREEYERRLRQEFTVRIREAEDELNQAYRDKVAVLDRRLEQKELALEQQRITMKNEMMTFEERSKAQAMQWLQREKDSILADVKKFHEKLMQEQERIDEERTLFEQQLSLKYAGLYEKAKNELQEKMITVTELHTSYWQRCEETWLDFRAEEMAILYKLRSEHEERMFEFAKNAAENAQALALKTLRAEQALLDERESNMLRDIEAARIAQESASRERALRLLDERNKLQDEAEQKRAVEEARLWEQLEQKVLEKEKQADANRRILELELRTRYESMISAERHRVDQLLEQQRREARALYEKHEASLREREEQWHQQRLAVELQEKDGHERQYHELRNQCENRLLEERRRFEAVLQQREVDFESERNRIMTSLESQFREHETSLRAQVATLRADYELRIKSSLMENQRQREQYLNELAELEQRFVHTREQIAADGTKRFEKLMADVRSQVEQRLVDQQTREQQAREEADASRRAYEERINAQYEQLLAQHQTSIIEIQKERDRRVAQLEKEHQEQVLTLKDNLERSLSNYFNSADARTRETAESVRSQFQKRLDEFNGLLDEERKARRAAEDQLAAARDHVEELRSSVEEHKLEVYRTVQAQYEELFREWKTKIRREKQELAQRHLEEEEKLLAKELLRGDDRNRTVDHARPLAASFADAASSSSVAAPVAAFTESQRIDLEMVNKRKEKLDQLWQVLDVPAETRRAFAMSLEAMTSPSQRLEAINREVKRLEEQLPILEAITKREFLQHRIHELERTRLRDPSAESMLRDLRVQITSLTQQIKQDITKYEEKHRSTGQRFLYRGQVYLDTLQSTLPTAHEGVSEGGMPLRTPSTARI